MVDAARLLEVWKSLIVRYPDGTPRTKQVVSKPIIEVDDEAGTATCRWGASRLRGTTTRWSSRPTSCRCKQSSPAATSPFEDRFESIGGQWRYTYRDLTLIDMVGDISRHLTYPIRSHRAPQEAPERSV
jgi:hypothetical protein